MRTIRNFAALALSVFAAAVVGAQETSCDAQARMVLEAIPASVGSPSAMERLLRPTVGAQLSATFDPARAAGIVRDSLAPDARCTAYRKGEAGYDCRYNGAASVLKIEMDRGKVAYLNRTRSERKGEAKISEADAIALARQAAEAVGMPLRELGTRADVRTLRLTAASEEGTVITGEAMGSEVHVRYQRRIGDVPVAFSRFHAAIDARGEIARMHVRWPDFRLAPGLSAANTASREQVIAQVLDQVGRDNRCGSLSRVVANVVYARTAVIDGGEAASEDGRETESGPSEFAPALMVTVFPVAQREDSGVPQMPVQNYVFPLLHGADGTEGQ